MTARVRTAGPDDAKALRAAFGSLGALDRLEAGDPGVVVAVAEDGAQLLAALIVEPGAHPLEPDWATASPAFFAPEAVESDRGPTLRALHETADAALRAMARPARALAVQVEVTDAGTIKRYEGLGFRAAGGGAYRVVGPGMVEHLHGYTDPQGYVVDLVRPL